MTNKLVVLNEDKNDCAAACLSSIIIYHGGYLNMETIKEIINTTKQGTTAYDLINGSKKIGFNAFGKKVLSNELKYYIKDLPFIAHVKKGNMYHFVVIYKIDIKKNKILYMDPTIGFINASINKFSDMYLNTILIFKKIKELPKVKRSNELLKEIILNILKDKKTLILLSVTSLITFIFSLLESFYYKLILDNTNYNQEYIYNLLYIFGTFIIIKNLFNYFRNKLLINSNYNLEIFINNKVIDKVFNLPYLYYKNKTTGEIISRFSDLDSLRELMSNLILNSLLNIILVVLSFIVMFIINYKLSLIAILIIIMYILIVKIYRNLFDRKIRLLQESKGIYTKELMENIDGMESIKNLGIKNIRTKKICNSYKYMCDINKSLNLSLNRQQLLKNIICNLGIIIFLTFGMLSVLKNNLKLSDLMLLYMIVSYFIDMIKDILDKDIDINYNIKNLNKINTLLTLEEENTSNDCINGNISIKNLSYSYSDNKVLNNINLCIKEKDKILIKGKSGSGKSTLIKILLKYLKSYKGNIKINNLDYECITENIINNSFTYIGQNEKIFTDTFKNNILLDRNINNKDYEKVINICELNDIRSDDYLIEESGFNLSGGERQRIVLARSLLKKSNYIIIDEALSEVDVELEKKIIKNICEYYKDKTIIYVSHKKEIQNLFSKRYDVEGGTYDKRRIK